MNWAATKTGSRHRISKERVKLRTMITPLSPHTHTHSLSLVLPLSLTNILFSLSHIYHLSLSYTNTQTHTERGGGVREKKNALLLRAHLFFLALSELQKSSSNKNIKTKD